MRRSQPVHRQSSVMQVHQKKHKNDKNKLKTSLFAQVMTLPAFFYDKPIFFRIIATQWNFNDNYNLYIEKNKITLLISTANRGWHF